MLCSFATQEMAVATIRPDGTRTTNPLSPLAKWLFGIFVAVLSIVVAMWVAIVPPAYTVIIAGVSIAGMGFIQFLLPHIRHAIVIDSSHLAPLKHRREFATGLVLVTAAIVASFGLFVWLQYPREKTNAEYLGGFYIECENVRTQSVASAKEFSTYVDSMGQWWIATRYWISKNMPEVYRARFQSIPRDIPMPLPDVPWETAHKNVQDALGVFCGNLERIMDAEK